MKTLINIMLLGFLALLIQSCSPDSNSTSRTEKDNNSHDAMVDHTAYIDEFILDQSDYTIYRYISEANVDGAAEIIVNQQMDKQAEELKQQIEEAKIHRVENGIHLSFSSDMAFGPDSEFLNLKSKNILSRLALILNKYDNNGIMIEAHTDALGEQDYNLKLTRNRSQNIKEYLVSQGVEAGRILTRGYGGSQPIADNDTPGGQLLNRRIDIGIFPGEDAKDTVLSGDIK